MRHQWLRVLSGLVLIGIIAGCTEPREEPLPSELQNAEKWGEVSFNGTIGEVYADQPAPTTEYTRLFLYFPYDTPSNPNGAKVVMNLRLESASEALPGGGLPDTSSVLGAPATSILSFNRTNFVYSGIIVPYVAGEWTLEFYWDGSRVDMRTYMPFTITAGDSRRAVVPIATELDKMLIVLAWLEPPEPIPGEQSYRLLAWRSRQLTQAFDLDSTLTVQLAFPETADPPDTSIAVWEDGGYTGTLSFPLGTSWEVTASVAQDTLDVGSAVFQLE